MTIKKSIFLLASVLFASTAFAAENSTEVSNSKLNLDVLGSVWYTRYAQLKNDSNNVTSSDYLQGFNVNASALYSILETPIGSPVVGLGLNYTRTANTEKFDNSPDTITTFSTISAIANGGFKFKLSEKFAIFTLANLGYGFYNDYGAKSGSVSQDISVKNHFLYGATVMASHEVAKNFNVGVGLTYNRHSFKVDSVSVSLPGVSVSTNTNQNLSFNEYSANLTASYSL